MYAVTFALPDESGDFRRRLVAVQKEDSLLRGELHGRSVMVAHIGVGNEAADAGIRRFLEKARPEVLICAGYGGGLDPALRVGDVVLDLHRTPTEWHPKNLRADVRLGEIHTQANAAESLREKRDLFTRSGAAVVDMETTVVAEACASAGVPFLALRVISDEAAQPLPVPMPHWFDLRRQRPRPFGLVCYLASHPSRILPFTRFVRGLPGARRHLAACLSNLLQDFATHHQALST
jgi:adenosylhomocysteine nucleosidase